MIKINSINNDEIEKDEIVQYDIIHEGVNIYELEDESTVIVRTILLNMVRTTTKNEEGQTLSYINPQNLIAIYAPKEKRGKKGKTYAIEELEKYIVKKNMMYRQIKDGGENVYKVGENEIVIKNQVKQIDKTSKFDALGMPSYIVRSMSEVMIRDLSDDQK